MEEETISMKSIQWLKPDFRYRDIGSIAIYRFKAKLLLADNVVRETDRQIIFENHNCYETV